MVQVLEGLRYIRRDGTVTLPLRKVATHSYVVEDELTGFMFRTDRQDGYKVISSSVEPEDLMVMFNIPEELCEGAEEWFGC